MTAKTSTGWREAEALANEGCAATLDTAHEALVGRPEMLQYHGRDPRLPRIAEPPRPGCGRNGTGSWNAPTRHEATTREHR